MQAEPYWRSEQAVCRVADILLDFARQGEQGALGNSLQEKMFR
jgi:hypothetical protein